MQHPQAGHPQPLFAAARDGENTVARRQRRRRELDRRLGRQWDEAGRPVATESPGIAARFLQLLRG